MQGPFLSAFFGCGVLKGVNLLQMSNTWSGFISSQSWSLLSNVAWIQRGGLAAHSAHLKHEGWGGMRSGHDQKDIGVRCWWQSSHLHGTTCGFSLVVCPYHIPRLLEPIPTFPIGQQEPGKCRRILYNIKSGAAEKAGLANGSPCWCRHRAWQLRGRKKDHSGQKITEESGEKTTHCFKSNAVEQTSLPNCRAKTPLITEAF